MTSNPFASNQQHPHLKQFAHPLARTLSLTSSSHSPSPTSKTSSRSVLGGRPYRTSGSSSHLSSLPPPPSSIGSSARPLSCASNSHLPRCVSRFRSFTGISSPTSTFSAAAPIASRPSTSSSNTTIFRPFLRHRARRLSDCSLTDLSPPTIESDLDLQFSPPADSGPQSENPPSPHSSMSLNQASHRQSLTHTLFNFSKLPPPKSTEQPHLSSMSLFRSDSGSSTSSFHLRGLCSKLLNGDKNHSTNHNQTNLTAQERSGQLALRRQDSLSSLGNVVSTAQQSNSQTEMEELESICSPPKALWVDTDRAAKMEKITHVNSHSGKSSASPSHFSTPSFSRRPSAESERGPSTRPCHSPRRGPAPPPIKVPKLRAALVAVTAHGDISPNPSGTASVLSRHRATGSESNVIRDRRCGGLGWPTLTRSESFNNLAPRLGSHAMAANRESNSPGSDALENLAGSPPSTKVQISISGPLKQPQPVPAYHSSSNGASAEVMPSTLPISRHSRSINSLSSRQTRRLSPSPSPSPRSVSPIPTPTSADNAKIVSVSHRLTKADNLATPPQRISLINPSSQMNSEPRRAMPFPISKPMSSSADDDAKANEASFPPHHSGLLPETPRVRRLPSTDSLSQRKHRLDSTASFDVRNLPFTFDGCVQTPTSQSSENTLQRLSIPQSPFIPQLIAIPQLPRIPSITGPMPDSGSNLRSVRSNGSNSTTFTPRRYHSRVFTPSTSTESIYSPHTNGRDPERHPRSRSADDLSVATNDPTQRFASRPRSMSDRGPDRPILLSNYFNGLKKSPADPGQHLPERPFSIVSSFAHPGTTRSFPWATRSIDTHLRDLDTTAQNQLVDHALKLYPMNAHRFVVGDTTKLLAEGRECEERAQELHVRYLSDMAKRERLLKRHVVTLRAFNGEEGARFGDSLIKAINQSDAGVSELLSLVDHTSRVERMCDSHWRAAAAVEMRTLQNIREKLSAAEAKIQLLEADRARDQCRIEELEARLRSSPQQSEVEPQRRKGTLPNGVNPGLPFPATSNGQGSFSPSVPGQTAPLTIRNPSNAATRPPMRRLNFVNTGPRVMSVFEVSSNRSSSAASPIIQPARLRLFDRRFGGSSTDQSHDPLGPNAGLQHFESPREAPIAPIVTPEHEPTASLTRAPHQANPVITQEACKPVKRPGLQFGQAARNLFTSNLRRKACELVGPSNPASMLSPRERPQPNQFATWSPESAARRHEPLSNLFMPPTIEQQTGVHETVLVPQQHRGQIAPQVPPTQLQLAPPPPPPGSSKLAPFRATEGSGSRGRPKWDGCDGSGGNLTSITLSQLGSLDIAHLLTDLAPTPSPTLRIFNQAGGPSSFSTGSSLVAQS